MTRDAFEIRTMMRPELDTVLAWAEDEGWNPGQYDGDSYYLADPDGFFVGLREGEPIASISAVRYGDGFGFLGLYIVRPEFRGCGFGMRLWRAGLEHLGTRVAGLDGVVERQEDYRRSGFEFAFRNMRFSGLTSACSAGANGVVPLREVPFADLSRYDGNLFPAARDGFLQAWVRQRGSQGFAIIGKEGLAGYGVIRPSRVGYRIGPLFAEDDVGAELLFQALAGSVPSGQALFIDLPEPNGHALDLVERHGMSLVFETARMYKGKAPQLPLAKIFGVTTFELG